MSSYLDSILSVAENAPSEEDTNILRRLKSIGGSLNYQPANSTNDQVNNQSQSQQQQLQYTPPPTPNDQIAQKSYQNLEQLPNRQDFPTSKTRRILGDIGGTLVGVMHHDPFKGIQTAEEIKQQPYRQALSDYMTRESALKQPLQAEQAINRENTDAYRVGGTQAVNIAKLDQGKNRLEFDKYKANASDEYKIKTLKQKANELAQRIYNETDQNTLSALKTQLENTNRNLDRASREKIAGERNVTSTKNAQIIAGSRNEPSSEEVQAAEAAKDEMAKTRDPSKRANILKNLTPKSRQHLSIIAPEATSTRILDAQEINRLDATNQTLNIIPKIREIIGADPSMIEGALGQAAKDIAITHPELLGPVSGNLLQLKDWIGTNPEQSSELVGYLTDLLLNESSMYTSGRASNTVLNALRNGGLPALKQAAPQFLGRLTEKENTAKMNYKTLTDQDYQSPSKYKVTVVGDAPDK